MKLSIAIVLYRNHRDLLIKTIKSVLNTELEIKLYLSDNSPTDELRDLEDLDRRIKYIFNNANNGFGAGHNVIMNEPSMLGRYHLVLNPDIYFESGVLEQLVEFMELNQEVGLCMPMVKYPNGDVQHLAKLLPTPVDWIGRFFVPSKKWKARRNYNFEMHFSGYNTLMDVPYLSGCFMFLRSSVIAEVGLFDEGIFMYGEDTDLTRRIHQNYRTVFYPGAEVVHEFNKGSHKNFRLFWIHVKAAIYYFNKWGWLFDQGRRKVNRKIKQQFNLN